MNKSVIRLLTLTISATALVAVPTVTPAKAAANGSQQVKKHKSHKSPRVEAPKASNQAPYYANPNDNPDRKVSYQARGAPRIALTIARQYAFGSIAHIP